MNPSNPKSVQMAVYNKARAAARLGKTFNGQRLEIGRLNRAFGLLQVKEQKDNYNTTLNHCDCRDSQLHPEIVCKHREKKMMQVRVAQATQAATPQPKPQPKPIDPAQVLFGQYNDWTAEQISPAEHRIHTWSFEFEAIEFIQAHPEIKWVRPDKAIGRRLRPDEQH